MLVEATGDTYWGSGLNLEQTRACLLEYWPGQNKMGVVLHAVRQLLNYESISDHYLVGTFALLSADHGPGIWRFPAQLLGNTVFVELIQG